MFSDACVHYNGFIFYERFLIFDIAMIDVINNVNCRKFVGELLLTATLSLVASCMHADECNF